MITVPLTTILSSALTVAGALLFVRAILSLKSLLYFLGRCWRFLDESTQSYQIYQIPRTDGVTGQPNPLHRKALAYVTSLPSLEDSDRAHILSAGRKPNDFYLQPDPKGPVPDSFLGARLRWAHRPDCLLLRVRRQDRHRVLRPYLQHVESVADEIENRRKEVRLFTNSDSGSWRPIPFTHSSSFDTVVMDSELKSRVKSDLESFLKGRSYYARLGRVWKRSYLLHGPPGTGKTTFVAAMARFLNYDIYNLDLSKTNSDLKSLLLHTTPKSIILVEDLDRYLNTQILHVMDGVFSCCGEERVMVFTRSGNGSDAGEEAVDPAMLRPGRVDVHVHFLMCDFAAFKSMASGYLGLKDHKLYPQVEEGFLQGGARLSPAEIGEIMIANRGSPSRTIKSVINALHQGRRSVSGGSEPVVNGGCGEEIVEVGGGIGFGKEATVREIKKLYGLIKRSGSKRDGTLSVEMAAAAAAAVNAEAVAGQQSNGLEKKGVLHNSC